MSNFIDEVIKNAKDQIKYKETVVTGEVTADNGDGTYDVKIANSPTAYPNVETATYGDTFSVGEIAIITFEYGNKEMPRLWGHAKKIKQNPVEVEVDYSGGTGGGGQTVEITKYCTSASGVISATEKTNNYNKIHDSIDGDDLYNIGVYTGSIFVDQAYNGIDRYGLERGYILFDTSAIPIGAIISSAILYLYCISKSTTTDCNIVIQDGQPTYPHNPPTETDWYYANYKNNGGQKLASSFTLNSYNTITLNSNGVAWINKGGITKLCLRTSQDISKTAPVNDSSYIGFIASETYSGSSNYAKITITYTI